MSKKYEKIKEVLQIGEGVFDLKLEEEQLNGAWFKLENHLVKKIENFTTEELESFFDYQYEKSSNQVATIQYLFFSTLSQSGKGLSEEIKEVGAKWLEEKSGIKAIALGELIYHFKQESFTDPIDVSDWQTKVALQLNSLSTEEILKSLSFGKSIGEFNYELHKTTCKDHYTCPINKNYEMKINFCQFNIDKAQKELSPTPTQTKPLNRIQWNGNQKQLAELFIELKKKGWIEEFEYSVIKAAFTNSDSIHQYLKPATDRKTKENLYEKVYTTNYKSKFNFIVER